MQASNKKYAETHKFDYEEFYDFIKSEEVYNSCYETLCDDLLDEYTDYGSFVFSLPDIYNQMVRYLLRDKDGNSFYENQPFHVGYVEHYDGFLKYLNHLKEDYIIDVHTLNHDLLLNLLIRLNISMVAFLTALMNMVRSSMEY